jgi:hypothetical protein
VSDEPDPLPPAEARVRTILVELREAPSAPGDASAVTRVLRWQRPLRRALVGVGTTAGAFASGLRVLFGMGRR